MQYRWEVGVSTPWFLSVQGEVIEQQFGEKELCFRTLDLYTSAVLEASLNPTTAPKPEWRGAMDLMSQVSAHCNPLFFIQLLVSMQSGAALLCLRQHVESVATHGAQTDAIRLQCVMVTCWQTTAHSNCSHVDW